MQSDDGGLHVQTHRARSVQIFALFIFPQECRVLARPFHGLGSTIESLSPLLGDPLPFAWEPQHFLYLRPEPQGQGLLRSTLVDCMGDGGLSAFSRSEMSSGPSKPMM
jgi:hypothetical protein